MKKDCPKVPDEDYPPSVIEQVDAINVLRRAGWELNLPEGQRGRHAHALYSAKETAAVLRMSLDFVKRHLHEFPNAVRTPSNDVRIPLADIDAALKRWRIKRL